MDEPALKGNPIIGTNIPRDLKILTILLKKTKLDFLKFL